MLGLALSIPGPEVYERDKSTSLLSNDMIPISEVVNTEHFTASQDCNRQDYGAHLGSTLINCHWLVTVCPAFIFGSQR